MLHRVADKFERHAHWLLVAGVMFIIGAVWWDAHTTALSQEQFLGAGQ